MPADAWAAPSPCDGWSARDVVGHLIAAQRSFLSGHGHDLPEPDLAEPTEAWEAHADGVLGLLADPAVAEAAFDGHFGPTTVGETLARFYLFDMVVHRWDVAHATGGDERLTDAELDVLEGAIAGFGPALYSEGVCAAAVEPPPDADRQTRVLATLGRTA